MLHTLRLPAVKVVFWVAQTVSQKLSPWLLAAQIYLNI